MRNILIICHANTSRSIIAEELLRKMLLQLSADHIAVRSGGVAPYARDGALVSMDARLVLREDGIDVPAERVSTDLKANRRLIAEADLILAMTRQQLDMLSAFPEAAGKQAHTLKEFAGWEGDIEDPVGGDADVYAACRDEIKACLENVVRRLHADDRSPLSVLRSPFAVGDETE